MSYGSASCHIMCLHPEEQIVMLFALLISHSGGACCFLMWILPQGLLLPLAIVGKLAIAGAFAVAFPYTTETFFTVN